MQCTTPVSRPYICIFINDLAENSNELLYYCININSHFCCVSSILSFSLFFLASFLLFSWLFYLFGVYVISFIHTHTHTHIHFGNYVKVCVNKHAQDRKDCTVRKSLVYAYLAYFMVSLCKYFILHLFCPVTLFIFIEEPQKFLRSSH